MKPLSKKFSGIAGRIGLVLLGLSCGILSVVGLLELFPDLLPRQFRDPLDQRSPNEIVEVRYTEDMGNLFVSLPGEIRPPENPQLLAEYTLRYDENGFRLPALTAAHYPIVALGDSFTEAWEVATPWTDVLAQTLNIPVQNLGFRGYGPLEYAEIMDDYGRDPARRWVLMAFFEGNDLTDIERRFRERDQNGDVLDLVRGAVEDFSPKAVSNADGNYKYPLGLIITDQYHEMAFYDFYLWLLDAPDPTTYARSQNVVMFREALQSIRADSGDACLGVIYIPSKEHIYFPYADPAGRSWILGTAIFTQLDQEGWLDSEPQSGSIELDTLRQRFPHHRDAIQTVVEDEGWHFFDLTPAFEAAAAEAQILYLKYDTHFNQAGHELAGTLIADFLRNTPDCALE